MDLGGLLSPVSLWPTFDSSPAPDGNVLEGAGNISDPSPAQPTENESQDGFLGVEDENNQLNQDGPSETEIARDLHKKHARTVSRAVSRSGSSSVVSIENLGAPEMPNNRPPISTSPFTRVSADLSNRSKTIRDLKLSSKELNKAMRRTAQDLQRSQADFAADRNDDDLNTQVKRSADDDDLDGAGQLTKREQDFNTIVEPRNDNVDLAPGAQSSNKPQPVKAEPPADNAMDGPPVPVEVGGGDIGRHHREGSPFQQVLGQQDEQIVREGVRDAFNAAPGSGQVRLQIDPPPEVPSYGGLDKKTQAEFKAFQADVLEINRLLPKLEKEAD